MVQCFADRYALRWIKREQPPDKIKKLPVDGVRGSDHFLKNAKLGDTGA